MKIEERRGKIKDAPAPEVVKRVIKPWIETGLDYTYQVYLDINKAHVLMLAKQGIIAEDVAKQILKVTDEMAQMGNVPTFPLDTSREDLYFNLEHYLIERTSLEIGGQQHTARSRNDLIATGARLTTRQFYVEVCDLYNKLRQTLIDLAKRNTDAVMSGYTHLQPSEPITFAHYCSAILGVMERDYRRLNAVYDGLNRCPLGGGSMGSTTFKIDREMTSELLGFDRPLDNSIDCVASRDYAIEFLSALTMMTNTYSRLCTDLYIWATPDYGYVEVEDSVAVCSSIMPQKKNPWTLEVVKGKAGQVEGAFNAALNSMKNTPFTLTIDGACGSIDLLPLAVDQTQACTDLLIATLRGLKLNKERMVKTAMGNFCTVTELANYLVRHDKISFRSAHEIVALVVDYMITNDKKADEIGVDVVNNIFKELFGQTSCMTDADVQEALNPLLTVQAKNVLGGPAESEVLKQLASRQAQLDKDVAEHEARVAALAKAKANLEKCVQDAIA